ncbi:MAG: cyclodeaminase/cyclohydrolase family protein [Planctomycetota bacterium]
MTRDRELVGGLEPFLSALAGGDPTPGGGAVAALAGALAAALGSMVGNLTIGRPRYAAVESRFRDEVAALAEARREFSELAIRDAEAFEGYMAALKLPKDGDEAKARRREALRAASLAATEVPMATLRRAASLLPAVEYAAAEGNAHAVSDAGIAALLVETAVRAAGMNVAINLGSLAPADRERIAAELDALTNEALPRARAVAARVEEALRS